MGVSRVQRVVSVFTRAGPGFCRTNFPSGAGAAVKRAVPTCLCWGSICLANSLFNIRDLISLHSTLDMPTTDSGLQCAQGHYNVVEILSTIFLHRSDSENVHFFFSSPRVRQPVSGLGNHSRIQSCVGYILGQMTMSSSEWMVDQGLFSS